MDQSQHNFIKIHCYITHLIRLPLDLGKINNFDELVDKCADLVLMMAFATSHIKGETPGIPPNVYYIYMVWAIPTINKQHESGVDC